MTVKDFIEQLGGVKGVSESISAPYTTVHGWVRGNRVPEWRMAALAGLAVRKGVHVPAEFTENAA